MASSLPPELLQFLQEQQDLERSKGPYATQREPNIKTSRANMPAVQKGGVFSNSGSTLKALGKGAAKAAGAIGTAATVVPIGWEIGKSLGNSYNQVRQESADKAQNERFAQAGYSYPFDPNLQPQQLPPELGGPPATPQGMGMPQTAQPQMQAQPAPVQQFQPKQYYMPEELVGEQAVAQAPMPQAQPVQVQQEEVPPEMMVEATEDVPPEMLVEAQLLQQQAPPRVEEFPQSRETLQALGKNKTTQMPVRRETPKRGFFGHVGEFLRTGGRNRERDDYNAELETYERANRLTDPEKLSADIAKNDVFSARAANFGGDMAKYSGQGVSPADKYMADYYSAIEGAGLEEQADVRKGERDSALRIKEIQAGAASQKLSPESVKASAGAKLIGDYPDLFEPEQVEAYTGIKPTAEGLKNLAKSRIKTDDLSKFLLIKEALGGRLGGAPDKTPASQKLKQKPEIKDTSMLQKTEK